MHITNAIFVSEQPRKVWLRVKISVTLSYINHFFLSWYKKYDIARVCLIDISDRDGAT